MSEQESAHSDVNIEVDLITMGWDEHRKILYSSPAKLEPLTNDAAAKIEDAYRDMMRAGSPYLVPSSVNEIDVNRRLERELQTALYELTHARDTALRMKAERDAAIKDKDKAISEKDDATKWKDEVLQLAETAVAERDMALRALYGILKPIADDMRAAEQRARRDGDTGYAVFNAIAMMQDAGIR